MPLIPNPSLRLALLGVGLTVTAASWAGGQDLAVSLDTTVVLDGSVIADHVVTGEVLGSLVPLPIGALPASVDVAAFHAVGSDYYLSLDTTAALPGGVTAEPRDVVRSRDGRFTVFFDGSAVGLPRGVAIDALVIDENNGDTIFSLDVDAALPDLFAADEDLVRFDGGRFELVLDSSAEGASPALDLDAAARDGDDWIVSFDTSGVVDGVPFDDGDALIVVRGQGWGPAVDEDDLAPGDLDALDLANLLPGALFFDGFESGNFGAWSQASP
ncbi:MAG: hypothetical protein AAGN66_25800 [Acidobacteriota bacterium]